MNHLPSRLLLSFVILWAAFAALPVAAQELEPGWQSRHVEVVIELDPGEEPDTYAPYFLSRLHVPETEYEDRINHVYTETITGFSVYLTETELDMAERLFAPGAYGVEAILEAPELRVPDMSQFGIGSTITGLPLKGDGSLIPNGLLRTETPMPEAPGDYADVDIAVIDTGIDATHGQLNVVGGTDCTADLDGRDTYGADPYGHGTHVAGVIAASYAANGVVGMAPGARLWDVRVLDENGGGNLAGIICGVEFVAANDIPIANMSLGGNFPESECGDDDPLHNAICIASEETTFVVAAGNAGQDAATQIPASYDEVVAVSAFADFDGRPGGGGLQPNDRCAAMSYDDELAAFSNHGPKVALAAPGACVYSTLPENTYGHLSGTSMAAPHVAGAFARWLTVNPGDDQREHMAAVWIEWSGRNGTADRYEGSHSDDPAPLLYVGEMPDPWEPEPEPEFTEPVNISR